MWQNMSSAAVVIGALRVDQLKPNGISSSHQLDQSITVLKAVGWYYFYSYSNLYIPFCKQAVEALARCRVLNCLYVSQKGRYTYMS